MKKVISVLLTVTMLLASAGVVSAREGDLFSNAIDKMATYTTEQRNAYFAYFRPFITTDTGVSAAIMNLGTGVMDSMIQDMLGAGVKKDVVENVFYSFSCIDEETNIRLDYADIFQNKIPLTGMSSSTEEGIDIMKKAMFRGNPSVEKIFKEDGVTTAVFANLLTAIPKINGNKKFIAYKNETFSVNEMNKTVQSEFNALWKGYESLNGNAITYEAFAEKMKIFLNEEISDGDKSAVAAALSDLGICKTESAGGGSGGSGSGGGSTEDKEEIVETKVKPTKKETKGYSVLASYEGVTADLLDGGFIIKTTKTAKGAIEIFADRNDIVLREFLPGPKGENGATLLVKYSVPTENGLLAQVKPDTVYLVRPAAAYPFIDANGWGKTYIDVLYNRGIVSGKTNTTFEPDAGITREEFVKLVIALFEMTNASLKVDFDDVAEGTWYYPYVASAYANNIINGIDENHFGTGQKIKRQDMAKIIDSVLKSKGISGEKAASSKFADFDTISDYAKEPVLAIAGLGIISGDDQANFNPNQFATRQEAAKMVYGMLQVYISSQKE